MKRKLKNFDKSFKEFNKRRTLREEKPLTEKAYANLASKIAVSRQYKTFVEIASRTGRNSMS